MAVALRETDQCVDFFQQTILRTVRQWQESEAVQQVDVPVLDRNRLTILNIINRGLEYQPSWPELKELVILLASYMERRGHWDVWQGILDEAIRVGREVQDFDGEITLTALFARLSQRQSRGKDVVRYYRRAIRLAKQHGNQFEEARACSNLGYYYSDSEHWWRSEVLSCHALALFEEQGNEHGRAHTHNHLGALYMRMGQWDKAQSDLSDACKLWRAAGDIHSLIYGLENLGGLCNEVNRPKEAIAYLYEALDLVERTGEQAEKGTILNNIGNSYIKMEEYDVARHYLEMAQETHRLFSNTDGMAHVWHNLGVLAIKNHQLDRAERFLHDSLGLYKEVKNLKEYNVVMFDLIDCLISKGNLYEANVRLDRLEQSTSTMVNNRHRQPIGKKIAQYHRLLKKLGA